MPDRLRRHNEYLLACLYAGGVIGVLFTGYVQVWLVIFGVVGLWASSRDGAQTVDGWLGRQREYGARSEHERIP